MWRLREISSLKKAQGGRDEENEQRGSEREKWNGK
jgi:hypothetical protein